MARYHLSTSEIARAVGVHPNTVRLYEAWGYLSPAARSPAGYRLFTELHLDQMRLARTALQGPYPGGKELVDELVRRAVAGDLGGALERGYTYLARVRAERAQAEAAVNFLERWAQGAALDDLPQTLQIGQAARLLDVTCDALRNWERNGLIRVPRDPFNGYRRYTGVELGRLRVIRMLRRAGFTMMALLRAMHALDRGQGADLRQVLDTPSPGEEVYIAADRWISTLAEQEQRALEIIAQLEAMIRRWGTSANFMT
jgi:DNA-binding transcriptional MerR regulator